MNPGKRLGAFASGANPGNRQGLHSMIEQLHTSQKVGDSMVPGIPLKLSLYTCYSTSRCVSEPVPPLRMKLVSLTVDVDPRVIGNSVGNSVANIRVSFACLTRL